MSAPAHWPALPPPKKDNGRVAAAVGVEHELTLQVKNTLLCPAAQDESRILPSALLDLMPLFVVGEHVAETAHFLDRLDA